MQNSIQARAGVQVLIDDHARDAQLLSIYQTLKLQRFAVQVAIQKKQLWYEPVISIVITSLSVCWVGTLGGGVVDNQQCENKYPLHQQFSFLHDL